VNARDGVEEVATLIMVVATMTLAERSFDR